MKPVAPVVEAPQRCFAEPLPISLEIYRQQVEWFRIKAKREMEVYRAQVELYALKFRSGLA